MFEIKNIIGNLAVNPDPNRVWKKRDLSDIKSIVVHQAICYKCSVEGIAKYHTTPSPINHVSSKGAPRICYHYVIGSGGEIYQCNHLNDITWHARGANHESIGICLLGDFEGPSWKGKETPTDKALQALIFLISNLEAYTVLEIEKIFGHCEIDPIHKENCPGNVVMDLIKDYRG